MVYHPEDGSPIKRAMRAREDMGIMQLRAVVDDVSRRIGLPLTLQNENEPQGPYRVRLSDGKAITEPADAKEVARELHQWGKGYAAGAGMDFGRTE